MKNLINTSDLAGFEWIFLVNKFVMPYYRMKHLIYILIIFFFSCQSRNSDNKMTKQSIDNQNIEHVRDTFLIGDINNDKKQDTAFMLYDLIIRKDSMQENYCANKECNMIIKFANNIPELEIRQSIGIYIKKINDLNNDKANEMMIFSRWTEGWWEDIYIYSFRNNKWIELAKTNAFLEEDKDWENRIVKLNSQYYLIGDDKWNESKGIRSLKVKITK